MSKQEAQKTQKATTKVAKKIAKTNKKGKTQRKHKVHYKNRFYRPKTQELARKPMYARSASSLFTNKVASSDKYTVLKYPLNTEKAMKRIEDENTLVYIVDSHASKGQIKEAFNQLHNSKVNSVNTIIRYYLCFVK
jgi:large subunit ribosomal protein L23Ae